MPDLCIISRFIPSTLKVLAKSLNTPSDNIAWITKQPQFSQWSVCSKNDNSKPTNPVSQPPSAIPAFFTSAHTRWTHSSHLNRQSLHSMVQMLPFTLTPRPCQHQGEQGCVSLGMVFIVYLQSQVLVVSIRCDSTSGSLVIHAAFRYAFMNLICEAFMI